MSPNHAYRPDIDGLRAIAVLSVIIFHANATWLPSGFLGVDIFFVISGFLITGIISRELHANKFSLKNFYLRRAKRILPAFLLVLLCTLIASGSLMLAVDFESTLKSARYSLMFAANVFFGREVGYFDASAAERPLQHIWSLSVEEQFYFVFPLLMLFLFRIWRGLPSKKVHVLFALLIIASVASFYVEYRKYDAYFLPWTRAFELLIGAWFALIASQNAAQQATAHSAKLSYLAAFAIIITLVMPPEWWPDSKTLPRLIICFATAYLLATGYLKPSKAHRLLAAKPLITIGLWSYSLYLWHWPIFSLMRYVYMNHPVPTLLLLAAIAATFVLSYFSYRFVEQPVRHANFQRRGIITAIACYVCLIFAAVALLKNVRAEQEAQFAQLTLPADCDSDCRRGIEAQPDILVIGDSHADQYHAFFDVLGKHEGHAIDIKVANACPILHISLDENAKNQWTDSRCFMIRAALSEIIKPYPRIILAQRWSQHIGSEKPSDLPSRLKIEPNYLVNLEKTLQWLIAQGKDVYVFSDNPYIGIYHYRHLHLQQLGINLPKPQPERPMILTEEGNRTIKALIARYPQVHWVEIDFTKYLPKDYQINGIPLYSDDDHLNRYGAQYLAQRFIEDGKHLIAPTAP